MKNFILLLLVFLFCGFVNSIISQVTGDYRSNPGPFSGNWSNPNSWEVYDGFNWTTAGSYPNILNSTNTIRILAGHSITLDVSPNVPNFVIETTATLKNTSSTEYGLILWGDLSVNGTLGGASHNIPIAINNTSNGTNIVSGSGIIGLLYFTKTDGTSSRVLDIQCDLTLYDTEPFKNNSGNSLSIIHTSGILDIPNASNLSNQDIMYNFNGTSNTLRLSSNDLVTQGIYSSGATIYKNLTLAGSGTKILEEDITVNGILKFEGTATLEADSYILTYGDASTLLYSGNSIQTTGDEWGCDLDPELGSNINNLEVDNSSGILLHREGDVDGTVKFTNGSITTGSNTLYLGTTGSFDASERSGNQLIGNVCVTRDIQVGVSQNFGNIGFQTDNANTTSLLNVVVTRISGDEGISSVGGSQSIKRKWMVIDTGGNIDCGLTIEWAQNEDNGKDANRMNLWNKVDGGWTKISSVISYAATAPRGFKTTVTSLSGTYTASDDLNLLPVELVEFNAEKIDGIINLSWKTATEVNNYGFEVERQLSVNADQLSEAVWETIGFVTGSGNSNSPIQYEFIDEFPPSAEVVYRLKQIDTDGSFEYFSTTVSINASSLTTNIDEDFMNSKYSLKQNFPNPFNPATNIQFALPKAGLVKLAVYNQIGQVVKTLINKEVEAGIHQIKFDGKGLSSGIYFYTMWADGKVITKKMLLLK